MVGGVILIIGIMIGKLICDDLLFVLFLVIMFII